MMLFTEIDRESPIFWTKVNNFFNDDGEGYERLVSDIMSHPEAVYIFGVEMPEDREVAEYRLMTDENLVQELKNLSDWYNRDESRKVDLG